MKERFLNVNGIRHHVLDEGEGKPVLLLHGFPDSSAVWRHQIPALVAAGFRAIVPDLRGFGRTDAPVGQDEYRLEKTLQDVRGILDELGLEQPHLVCHDWGSIVGWHFAALDQSRVDRFVSLCVGHPNAFFAAGIQQLERFWYILLFQFRGLAEEALMRDDWALFRQWLRGHPDGDDFIADLSRPGRLTAALDWYRANLSAATLFGPHVAIPNIKAPTMVVWSTGDAYLTENPLLLSRQYVDGPFRYERVEALSHFVQLDRPAEINRLVVEHLLS